MLHGTLLATLTALFLAAPGDPPAGKDDKSGKKDDQSELSRKKSGRPGELTPEEEAKLDEIIAAFILHDTGMRPNPKMVEALRRLGPEAIPALIRGLNRSALLSHSCPVTMLAKKLAQLLAASDDDQVLTFARTEVGAGLPRTPYDGLLNNLKVLTSRRQAELQRLRASERDRYQKSGSSGSPGERGGDRSPPE